MEVWFGRTVAATVRATHTTEVLNSLRRPANVGDIYKTAQQGGDAVAATTAAVAATTAAVAATTAAVAATTATVAATTAAVATTTAAAATTTAAAVSPVVP